MPALRSVPKCRHRVCLRRPRPAASLRTLAGSNPSAWRRWLDLLDVRGSWLVWDGGIPRPPGRRPRPAASLRSLRAALENASRFLSSAPLRVRIPPLAHKKAPWAVMGLGRSVLMAGTEGFEPPTAGTKNRSSTVELRPNVWCCPKATRLVYLICEGIANAIEQAYGECLRVAGREGAVVARHARELNANACRLLLCGDIGSADALG